MSGCTVKPETPTSQVMPKELDTEISASIDHTNKGNSQQQETGINQLSRRIPYTDVSFREDVQ
jgi:hypothetical protein